MIIILIQKKDQKKNPSVDWQSNFKKMSALAIVGLKIKKWEDIKRNNIFPREFFIKVFSKPCPIMRLEYSH